MMAYRRWYGLCLRRAFGLKFCLSLVLVAACYLMDAERNTWLVLVGRLPVQGGDTAYYFELIVRYGVYYQLYQIFAAIPFACAFSEEWKNGFSLQAVKRCGSWRYTYTHVGLSAISGGLASAGGLGLYFIVMGLKYKFYDASDQMAEILAMGPYGELLAGGEVFLYILAYLVLFFFAGSIMACLAEVASVYVVNPYMSVVTPYLLCRIYIELAKCFSIPANARLDWLLCGRVKCVSSITGNFIWITVMAAAVWVLSGVFFRKKLRWRIENDRQ